VCSCRRDSQTPILLRLGGLHYSHGPILAVFSLVPIDDALRRDWPPVFGAASDRLTTSPHDG